MLPLRELRQMFMGQAAADATAVALQVALEPRAKVIMVVTGRQLPVILAAVAVVLEE
jgi:hypothetical protein